MLRSITIAGDKITWSQNKNILHFPNNSSQTELKQIYIIQDKNIQN
jgi:hypothetical protein